MSGTNGLNPMTSRERRLAFVAPMLKAGMTPDDALNNASGWDTFVRSAETPEEQAAREQLVVARLSRGYTAGMTADPSMTDSLGLLADWCCEEPAPINPPPGEDTQPGGGDDTTGGGGQDTTQGGGEGGGEGGTTEGNSEGGGAGTDEENASLRASTPTAGGDPNDPTGGPFTGHDPDPSAPGSSEGTTNLSSMS